MHLRKLKTLVAAAVALVSLDGSAQDLLASQAPIDRTLKSVDSLSLKLQLMAEDLEYPAFDLYEENWDTRFVNAYKGIAVPDSFRIDLTGYAMPTESRRITSKYGYRWRRMHRGLDVKVYVGDTIRFAYNYTGTRTGDQAMWDNMKTIVTGGRMLVQNKQNVTANSTYNSQYDSDPKQSNTSSSLRSFAAVMGDGRLLLGTASGTFPQIANDLIGLGAVHAISLDGGASSMLYADGSGFLTPAGRELAVVLTIVPQDPNEKPYENPESGGSGSNAIDPGVADPHTPSSWAAADVEKARSLGLIPSWLTYGYKGPITRAEFAATVLQLFPACLGKSADTVRHEMGIYGDEFNSYKFTDYDNYNVQLAAALGIVTGYEDGTFRPNNSITREQAAIMIQRAVKLLGTVTPTKNPTFTDAAKVSPWAAEGVQFVTSCGIMNGSNNAFNPQGTYTREQTFITMLNVYNALKGN